MIRPLQAQKLQGAFNDFLFIHSPHGSSSFLEWGFHTLTAWEQWVRKVCHRRRGFGADGVVVWHWVDSQPGDEGAFAQSLSQLPYESKGLLSVAIFNADGSWAATCGNALRCLGLLMARLGHWDGLVPLPVLHLPLPRAFGSSVPAVCGANTVGDVVALGVGNHHSDELGPHLAAAQVWVSMGAPQAVIPTSPLPWDTVLEKAGVLQTQLPPPQWSVFVQLNNPHWVFGWDTLPISLSPIYGALENLSHPIAEALGVVLQSQWARQFFSWDMPVCNIGFLGLQSLKQDIEDIGHHGMGSHPLVVYERGAGLTPSCGSGATAAAVALNHMGVIEKPLSADLLAQPVTFFMPGGTLSLLHREEPYDWVLGGPANWVGHCGF